MKTIPALLTDKVSGAFAQCGYPADYGHVTVSNRMDLCQFQCNGAFSVAGTAKKSPAAIAGEIAAVLADDMTFESVRVAGPGFINISVADGYLLNYVSRLLDDKYLGIPQAEFPETVFLDYGGPNVAKPLHIGHLRSAIIGESLKRLIRATGRKAVSDVHLGDWGLQIGLVIAELEERNPEWACFSDSFDAASSEIPALSAKELNEIYPSASKKSRENPEFKSKAQAITAKLQKGHPGYSALWKEIIRISVADIRQNYEKLNVGFDLWYGESDSEKYIDPLIRILTRKGLLHESNGAMVVDVSEESDKVAVPPVIIKKSDDSNIYATTDLAAILQRQADFSPAQIWYIVDNRQSLHFTQVFRCAEKAGLVPPGTRLEHLGFGTMNGSDGKPYKTRDGGVMQLSDFFSTVYAAAYRRTDLSEFSDRRDKADIARRTAVAAIKFGDLINHRSKDYVFNLDRFLSSEGKTGTFLLYTIARINSILKKASVRVEPLPKPTAIYSDAERELLLKIALSNEAFLCAFAERAPNYICESAYQIASAFSRFYHDHHILGENDTEKKESWLGLCLAAKAVLMKHLDVLGIEAVEFM